MKQFIKSLLWYFVIIFGAAAFGFAVREIKAEQDQEAEYIKELNREIRVDHSQLVPEIDSGQFHNIKLDSAIFFKSTHNYFVDTFGERPSFIEPYLEKRLYWNREKHKWVETNSMK